MGGGDGRRCARGSREGTRRKARGPVVVGVGRGPTAVDVAPPLLLSLRLASISAQERQVLRWCFWNGEQEDKMCVEDEMREDASSCFFSYSLGPIQGC
jgi:hypothetical protein